MTTLLNDIVNEVHLNLLGYSLDQEQLTVAAGAIASGDLSFSVADSTQLSPGVIEVDDELMWCSAVDPNANLVYVLVRGMYGSIAAAHSSGALVRNNPKYPRNTIKTAINNTLTSSYPDIFQVTSTTITANQVVGAYPIPAEAEEILSVSYNLLSPN